jgi:hypothetical protein
MDEPDYNENDSQNQGCGGYFLLALAGRGEGNFPVVSLGEARSEEGKRF